MSRIYTDDEEHESFDWSDTLRQIGYANENFGEANETEVVADVSISFLREALDLFEYAGYDAVSLCNVDEALGVAIEDIDGEHTVAVCGRVDGRMIEKVNRPDRCQSCGRFMPKGSGEINCESCRRESGEVETA
jgi:hypothetical protein